MKYSAVLVLTVLALAQADERNCKECEAPSDGISPREASIKAHDECQGDPATRIGRGASPDEYAAHTLCVEVKLGTLKPNGDVNLEGLRKFVGLMPGLDADKVEKIVADCSKRHGGTAEQAAMGLLGCIAKWTSV